MNQEAFLLWTRCSGEVYKMEVFMWRMVGQGAITKRKERIILGQDTFFWEGIDGFYLADDLTTMDQEIPLLEAETAMRLVIQFWFETWFSKTDSILAWHFFFNKGKTFIFPAIISKFSIRLHHFKKYFLPIILISLRLYDPF